MNSISGATRETIEALGLPLETDLNAIMGDWNGDLPGRLEDRADAAAEALELWQALTEILEELQ